MCRGLGLSYLGRDEGYSRNAELSSWVNSAGSRGRSARDPPINIDLKILLTHHQWQNVEDPCETCNVTSLVSLTNPANATAFVIEEFLVSPQLVDGVKNAGTHSVVFNAADLASDVYLYRLQTPGVVTTKKFILMK